MVVRIGRTRADICKSYYFYNTIEERYSNNCVQRVCIIVCRPIYFAQREVRTETDKPLYHIQTQSRFFSYQRRNPALCFFNQIGGKYLNMEFITKESIKVLKSGKKITLDCPIGENLSAHFILIPKDGECTAIRGYLNTLNPRGRLTTINEKSKKSNSYLALPLDIRDLRNSLVRGLENLNRPEVRPRAIRPNTFTAQVMSISDLENPNNFTKYVPRGWGKTTASTAVSYFARTFGHFYQTYGIEATESDYLEFFESEIDRIYKTQYKHPSNNGTIIKQRREQIYNDLISRWRNARAVQRYLLENHPEFGWPTSGECSPSAGHKLSGGGMYMNIKHQHPTYQTEKERLERLQEIRKVCTVKIIGAKNKPRTA